MLNKISLDTFVRVRSNANGFSTNNEWLWNSIAFNKSLKLRLTMCIWHDSSGSPFFLLILIMNELPQIYVMMEMMIEDVLAELWRVRKMNVHSALVSCCWCWRKEITQGFISRRKIYNKIQVEVGKIMESKTFLKQQQNQERTK